MVFGSGFKAYGLAFGLTYPTSLLLQDVGYACHFGGCRFRVYWMTRLHIHFDCILNPKFCTLLVHSYWRLGNGALGYSVL